MWVGMSISTSASGTLPTSWRSEVKRFTLFVTLTNESGNVICKGIYAEHDEWDIVKDDQHVLISELEEGKMPCLVLTNIGNGAGDRDTFGSILIPKKILDNSIVTMEFFDIEEPLNETSY
jgi:hypothetical protein